MKQETGRSSREESLGLHEMTGKTLIFTNTISTYHAASSNSVPFQAALMTWQHRGYEGLHPSNVHSPGRGPKATVNNRSWESEEICLLIGRDVVLVVTP